MANTFVRGAIKQLIEQAHMALEDGAIDKDDVDQIQAYTDNIIAILDNRTLPLNIGAKPWQDNK